MLLTSSKSIEESIQQSGHEAHIGYYSEPCNMSLDTPNAVIGSGVHFHLFIHYEHGIFFRKMIVSELFLQ